MRDVGTPPPPAMLLRANESMDLVNLRIDHEVIGVDQMPAVWTTRMLTMPHLKRDSTSRWMSARASSPTKHRKTDQRMTRSRPCPNPHWFRKLDVQVV